jgi:hypothetical protein
MLRGLGGGGGILYWGLGLCGAGESWGLNTGDGGGGMLVPAEELLKTFGIGGTPIPGGSGGPPGTEFIGKS